jgi:RNA-directed DNA polymerase
VNTLRFRRVSFTALHAERLTQGETRWSVPPLSVMRNPSLLRVLARSFLAGESTVEQITARAGRTLGRQWRWLQPLARRYLQAVADRTRPRHRDVIRFFLNDRGFGRAWSKHFHELSVEQWLTEPQRMQPVPAAGTWDVPRIESVGALCDWLWLDPGQLEWFADLKGLILRKNRPLLGHYHYRVLSKRDGTIRLIEAPKPRLKNCSGKSSPNFWSASHPTHPYTDSSKGDPSERSPPLMWVNGLSYGWI